MGKATVSRIRCELAFSELPRCQVKGRSMDSRRVLSLEHCRINSVLFVLKTPISLCALVFPPARVFCAYALFRDNPKGRNPMLLMRRFISIFVLSALLSAALAQTPQPSPSQPTPHQQKSRPRCTDRGTYVNSQGKTVKRPENCSAAPQGATAQCRDGSYSFSQRRRGTCSHRGGCGQMALVQCGRV